MKPDFKKIHIKEVAPTRVGATSTVTHWLTPEQIRVKQVYTKEDLEGMEHLNYAAGI